MKIFHNHKFFLLLTIVGFFLFPAIFVFAQTSDISINEVSALKDLSQVAGREITEVAQAKEICNLERFLADCAEIGKKHNLYKPEEIKTVNAVLAELKGKIVEDLKNCADEACLVDVANRLAKTISAKNPTIAKQIDMTVAKVGEKKTIIDAAKEAGVNLRECQSMDPNAASIDLLRSCAKLAKDSRVMKYIPEERKQLVQINDSSVNLREALAQGEYQCGDNTLDGCGNFCLNSSPEARSQGTSVIPQVCRDIANKFFGSDGTKQLEIAYSQVKQVSDFYYKQAQNITFTTPDGRVLLDIKDVGRYLENEGKKGNVEAVEKGMDFMVNQGFAKLADKEFAVKMIQKVREEGGIIDLDFCRRDPGACRQFIPEEDKAEFELMDWIHGIIKAEMNKDGVPGPEFCEDPRYGEKCLIASKRALPQVESIAASNPEAIRLVNDIKTRIAFGEQGIAAREKARQEFGKSGGLFFGERQFNNFEEVDNFCRTNGQECLTEAAKKGFIGKDFAEKKYEMVIEQQYRPEYNIPFGTTTFPTNFPGQGSYQGFIPPGQFGQGGYPPGQIPGFTVPGQGFASPYGINKEEALKLFKEWLENPQGQPPIPYFTPQSFNQLQIPQGQYPQYPQQQNPQTNIYPYPQYPNQYPNQPNACQQIYSAPCPIGQYREVKNDLNSCPIYGQCAVYQQQPYEKPIYEMPTSTTLPLKPIAICPALPTVVSCPSGQIKVEAFSSPECGIYYACKQAEILPPPPIENIQPLPVIDCSKYGSGWHTMDSSGNSSGKCFDSSMQNYRTADGILYSCAEKLADGCSNYTYNYVPPSGQREQIWNSLGLRSWIRGDADFSRIEQLKQACVNVPSNSNIWMPNAGLSSSLDFGMPDPNKCSQAAGCSSDKYFDGSSCISSSGGQYYSSDGSSCSSALTGLLGSGCHYMYNDSSGNQIYCDGPMTKSAKAGDTSTTSGCSSSSGTSGSGYSYAGDANSCPGFAYSRWDGQNRRYCQLNSERKCDYNYPSYLTNGSNYIESNCPAENSATYPSCASGQYWNGTACVNSTSYSSSCSSGQYWNGTACVNTTTSDVPIANCPSFAHEMSGYCMLNNDTSRCAEYSSATSETNYTSAVCSAHGSGSSYTSPSSGSTSCSSGQYWYVPTDGTAGYCKTSETSTGSTTSCPSPSYWDPAINACNSGTTSSGSTTDPATACSQTGGTWNGSTCVFPTTCPSGQYWDGSSCITSPSSNIATQHFLAQMFTIFRNFGNLLESFR